MIWDNHSCLGHQGKFENMFCRYASQSDVMPLMRWYVALTYITEKIMHIFTFMFTREAIFTPDIIKWFVSEATQEKT